MDFRMNGVGFDDDHVASYTEADWVKHGKEVGIFGRNPNQEDLLKATLQKAKELVVDKQAKKQNAQQPAPQTPKPEVNGK